MRLETDRLVLQELSWNDLDEIFAFHSIPDVARFNTIGIPSDKEVTRNIIRGAIEDLSNTPRSIYGWTVRMKETNAFVGQTGMSCSNNRFKMAEIHYHISPEFWKQGYATEIAKRLIKFGFEELKLHRIEAGVATDNIGSIRVLEKLGMQREGLRRKILPIRGEWRDNYMYSILDEEFRVDQ
ncbi:GNAT family N-acetyltransferase [Roseivirga sp. E12]|uniref:GNAT family N-acetyltransferase n=1 Tax=Roseivirga sp. E12 TaxID=2819237 RepID=UPI001ABC6964|nr:GNAT family N-acetyltransferase [Roseivirga sp. E12]MBO3697804.1 GNAT family N-acetyltransferase [Roseivirga sp. E12]